MGPPEEAPSAPAPSPAPSPADDLVSRCYPAAVYTEHLRLPVGVGTLHVERLGRGGPAVVLLHGFATCSFLWRAVAPVLATAGCTVVAIDLLGYGESDRPSEVAYGLGAHADYVERALTALRLGEVTVVGQDMGALIGLLLASRYPRLVSRVVLLEPLDPDDLPGPLIRALQRGSVGAALSANALFGAQPLLEPLLRAAVSDPSRMPDRLVARYLAPFVGGDGAADLLKLASTVMMTDDEQQALAEVSAEVVLWVGTRDAGDGERSAAQHVAHWQLRLPGARVVPMRAIQAPESGPLGALVAEDAPEPLAAALQEWIA